MICSVMCGELLTLITLLLYAFSRLSVSAKIPRQYIGGGYTYSVDRNWPYFRSVDCRIESDFCL